jgi:hypothetical protein
MIGRLPELAEQAAKPAGTWAFAMMIAGVGVESCGVAHFTVFNRLFT